MNARSAAIVLAAGLGTRMSSDLPKPLHPVAGRAMVLRVLDALAGANADPVVVVVGHEANRVRDSVHAAVPQIKRLTFVDQAEQLGTGDAARVGLDGHQALAEAHAGSDVVVVPGDAPLLRAQTIAQLVALRRSEKAAVSLLTARLDDPSGYGRVVRSGGRIAIVEHRDATPTELQIDEINAGVYCFDIGQLRRALPKLRRSNAVAEYYLTDAVGWLAHRGERIAALPLRDRTEAMGVNDAAQLAACEAILEARSAASDTQSEASEG